MVVGGQGVLDGLRVGGREVESIYGVAEVFRHYLVVVGVDNGVVRFELFGRWCCGGLYHFSKHRNGFVHCVAYSCLDHVVKIFVTDCDKIFVFAFVSGWR